MVQDFKLIQTERLDLYCLTTKEFLGLSTNPNALDHRGFSNPHSQLSQVELARENRVQDVRENPQNICWYSRLIVERASNVVIGGTSFHGGPDERGMIEIGLGIAEAERGKGYASEALRAMWDWAAKLPEVKFLRYTVSPDNLPSVTIIRKFGFPLIGEQIDPEDGLELIYEISVDEYLSNAEALEE
jgi:RimJ/RimL family protein N-acetyltransferase